MNKQDGKLSYSRLISRTNFYKDKSLELEKKFVFAQENMKSLQKEMERLNKEMEESAEEAETKEQELLSKLKEAQANEQELWLKVKEAEENAERLKNRQETEYYKKRLAGFENLLQDVQTELNQKEQQLETYKSRVKSLEKRLSSNRPNLQQPILEKADTLPEKGQKATAFFDYSLIFDENKSAVIRGNFMIENAGDERLSNPFVCFRFYPADALSLKGKIVSVEQAEQNTDSSSQAVWVYHDDEWAASARERGEIWVRPFEHTVLQPGERVGIHDFQIPTKSHYDEKMIIEGFVYFQRDDYKVKAANQILITF